MVASDLYYDVAYNGELEQSDFFPLGWAEVMGGIGPLSFTTLLHSQY